jgi:uncharacterized protein YjbI with pentapeptide repeats
MHRVQASINQLHTGWFRVSPGNKGLKPVLLPIFRRATRHFMKQKKVFIGGIVLGALITSAVSYFLFYTVFTDQTNLLQDRLTGQETEIALLRKNNWAPLLQNVLDKIDNELHDNPKRILSEETIERIAAMGYFFKPYLHLEGDTTAPELLSPERGQLLLLLASLNLDSVSYVKIKSRTSFEGADLREADLSHTDLRGADLVKADLANVNLNGARLDAANLSFANLWGCHASYASMERINLRRANLAWSNLNAVKFGGADLHEADLTSAQLREADLHDANLQWADFDAAFLQDADLTCTDMFRASMTRTQLSGANCSDANLTYVNLVDAIVQGTSFSGSILDNIVVGDPEWITRLKEWHVRGGEEIQAQYKMADELTTGEHLYQLVKSAK